MYTISCEFSAFLTVLQLAAAKLPPHVGGTPALLPGPAPGGSGGSGCGGSNGGGQPGTLQWGHLSPARCRGADYFFPLA